MDRKLWREHSEGLADVSSDAYCGLKTFPLPCSSIFSPPTLPALPPSLFPSLVPSILPVPSPPSPLPSPWSRPCRGQLSQPVGVPSFHALLSPLIKRRISYPTSASLSWRTWTNTGLRQLERRMWLGVAAALDKWPGAAS